MMGSAEELPQAPNQKVVFMEDMTENQLAKAVSVLHLLSDKCSIYVKKKHFLKVGIAVRIDESWKHVLHERNSAVLEVCGRAQGIPEEVRTYFLC